MTANTKTIKFLILPTLIFAVLTYAVSLNMDNCFLVLNSKYISNNFLLAVFGGCLTSSFVVLMVEFQKYLFNKQNAVAILYQSLLRIYTELSVMRGTMQSYIECDDEKVPKELFKGGIPPIEWAINNVGLLDYCPLTKTDILLKKLILLRTETLNECATFLRNLTYIEIAINTEHIKHMEEQNLAPFSATSKLESVRIALNKLIAQADKISAVISIFLYEIDDTCKNVYNWKGSKKIIDEAPYNIKDIHKATESFIKN